MEGGEIVWKLRLLRTLEPVWGINTKNVDGVKKQWTLKIENLVSSHLISSHGMGERGHSLLVT